MNAFDGIVIGGGPAGMFAAITAARQGEKVLLLERGERLGRKLLITGKGRCNVTNNCSAREVLENVPRNGSFLYSAMTQFPPERVMSFFEEEGCPLKTERGNRVFPTSDRSASILDCLKRELGRWDVRVEQGRVRNILTENGHVTGVETQTGRYAGRWVILATGGKSYPATGSTGDGYDLAARLGHGIKEPEGSLVPLETVGSECPRMQGLSLRNVELRLTDAKGKLLYKDFGELLFTHFGVSGPTVLSASCHLKGPGCQIHLDLKPALDERKLEDRLLRELEQNRNRSIENMMPALVPRSMVPVLLERLGMDPRMQANAVTKQQRRALMGLLKDFSLEIAGKRPVEEAIITSGGVVTRDLNPKTMMSKKISGLYFAGEIIDCDAYTGGFNLQIAWATAYAAAMGACGDRKGNS